MQPSAPSCGNWARKDRIACVAPGRADERDGQAALGGVAGPVVVGGPRVAAAGHRGVVRGDQEPVAGAVAGAGVAQPQPQPALGAVAGQPVRDLQPQVGAGAVQGEGEPDGDRGRARRPGRAAAVRADVGERVGRQLGRALQVEQRRVGVQARLGDEAQRVEQGQAVAQQHLPRLVLDADDALELLGRLVAERQVGPVRSAEGRPVVGALQHPQPGAVAAGRPGWPRVAHPGPHDQAGAVGGAGQRRGEHRLVRQLLDSGGQRARPVDPVPDLVLDLHRRLVQHLVAGAGQVGQRSRGGRGRAQRGLPGRPGATHRAALIGSRPAGRRTARPVPAAAPAAG